MKRFVVKQVAVKALVTVLALVFLADAVNSDILIAQGVNAVFHTAWNPISREVMSGSGTKGITASERSIANSVNLPQDEDSPIVLDTGFPEVRSILPIADPPPAHTLPGTVRHTYLSLCTLLL